jgi:hypothetical protein
MLVKGGMFRSRSHLKIYLEQHGLLKKGEKWNLNQLTECLSREEG